MSYIYLYDTPDKDNLCTNTDSTSEDFPTITKYFMIIEVVFNPFWGNQIIDIDRCNTYISV